MIFTFQSTWIQKLLAPNKIGHRIQQTNWLNGSPNFNQPPDLVISCGRQAAAAAGKVKQQTGCKHIHVLNPKGKLSDYDLLLLPKHDGLVGDNICCFTGSIHNIRPQSLQANHSQSTAVILGNPEKSYWKKQWIKDWDKIKKRHTNIIICGSPRLSHQAKCIIRQSTQMDSPDIWLDQTDGDNPYSKLLVNSGMFYVTSDSINMVNECLATGQTLHLLASKYIHSTRHQAFIQSVQSHFSKGQLNTKEPWPDPIKEIIHCDKFQNLLKSPSSFKSG